MATQKKISELDSASSLSESDVVPGNQGSSTKKITMTVLRTVLNSVSQTIIGTLTANRFNGSGAGIDGVVKTTGTQEIDGPLKADSFEGDGSLLTNVPGVGPGGTTSTGTLTLQCNSAGGSPSAKVKGTKQAATIFEADENEFLLSSGINYTHEDDAIPFDKDFNLQSKELLRSKTVLEMHTGRSMHYNGVDAYSTIGDDPNANFNTDPAGILIDFETTKDYSGGIANLVSKRLGGGNGFQVQINTDNTLLCFIETSTGGTGQGLITSDIVVNDGHHIVFVLIDPTGDFSMYIDGDLQSDVSPLNVTDLNNAEDLYFGSDAGASEFFDGTIYRVLFFNRLLTSEAKSWSSNPLKQLEYKDIGASQNELNTQSDATADNGGTEADSIGNWTSVGLTGTGANVFESQSSVVETGSYALHADANDTPTSQALCRINMESRYGVVAGKQYRLKFKWRHTGVAATDGRWDVGFDESGGAGIDLVIDSISVGDIAFGQVEIDFIYDGVMSFLIFKEQNGDNDGGIYIDDLSIKQLGCFAEWSSEGIEDNSWSDNQNGNDATNTNTVVSNKSKAPTVLNNYTTAEKNGLTAVNGMIIYDSTLNKFQGYENGAWVNLV
ncbi:LamG domain-containing protein [Candidatus Pacearchaeota archaeon]|nr:LamG domain-containing protein [Candidatus Pacearchaeota archaeon]